MVRVYLNYILILAMAISALSPNGYMPEYSDNGFTINICAGGLSETRSIDQDHPNYETLKLIYESKMQDHDAEDMQNECAYSLFNAYEFIVQIISLEALIGMIPNTAISIKFVDILRISGMPPPSTGPPSL